MKKTLFSLFVVIGLFGIFSGMVGAEEKVVVQNSHGGEW